MTSSSEKQQVEKAGHRVELWFDDGIATTKLIHPEDGCSESTQCGRRAVMFGISINVEDFTDIYGYHHRHAFLHARDARGRYTLRVHNGVKVKQVRWSDGPHSIFEEADGA